MVATLSTAAPVFEFGIREFGITPPTVESLEHSTPEPNASHHQNHGPSVAALPTGEPVAITRQASTIAKAIIDIMVIAGVLCLWVGVIATVGESAWDLYTHIQSFSPWELFHLFNAIP